jgi:hypothetical protein
MPNFHWGLSLYFVFAGAWISSGLLSYFLFKQLYGDPEGFGFFALLGPIGSALLLVALAIRDYVHLIVTACEYFEARWFRTCCTCSTNADHGGAPPLSSGFATNDEPAQTWPWVPPS